MLRASSRSGVLPGSLILLGFLLVVANLEDERNSFLPGTMILMADGTSKAIEQVAAGDLVLTRVSGTDPNPVTAVVERVTVKKAHTCLVINDRLMVTPLHRLWTTRGWTCAGELEVGDLLLHSSNILVPITRLEGLRELHPCYQLRVAVHGTHYADGFWAQD